MIAAIETTMLFLYDNKYLLACDDYGVLNIYGSREGRRGYQLHAFRAETTGFMVEKTLCRELYSLRRQAFF